MYTLRKTRAGAFIASLLMAFGMSGANAAPVNFTLLGTVDSADPGNIFNVAISDTITATGSFDDSLLTGGTGSVSGLLITVGDLTFDNSMESFGGAAITLNGDGSLFDFTYQAREGQLGALADFDSFFTSFTGSALNGPKSKGKPTALTIAGTWGSLDVAVVPVPAAVWLFGSGLIGLVGIARKNKKA